MKKLIALLATAAAISVSVFALPLPPDQENVQTVQTVRAGVSEDAPLAALAEARAVSLTDNEARAVDCNPGNPLEWLIKMIKSWLPH